MKTVWSQKTDFYQFISNLMNFQNLNLSGVFVSGAETFLKSNWQTRNFLFFFRPEIFYCHNGQFKRQYSLFDCVIP